jgi:hypothetical protein
VNDLIKHWVADSGMAWSAIVPLILFMTFFVGVVVWTWRQPDEAPPLE